MEKVTIIIGCIFLALLFIGLTIGIIQYESYGPKVGTVIDKRYTSEQDYYTYETQKIDNTTISIPKYHHEPEHWKIKLQKTENEKTKEIWIEIPKEEYNNIKIGEYYGE